jgi:hypothetical protein
MMLAQMFISLISPPAGPNTPFTGPTLFVLDSIRLLVIILGVGVILATPFAMARCKTMGQKIRHVALALFALSALGTEFDHIGDHAHWRLLANIIATVGAAYGIWALFAWERPAEI